MNEKEPIRQNYHLGEGINPLPKPLPNPFLAGEMIRECSDTEVLDWEEFRRQRELDNLQGGD